MGWIQVLKYFRVAAAAVALLAAGCNNHTISTRGQQEFLPQKVQQVKLDSLEKVARQLVARVKDDPKARVAIREEFYRKHGGGRFHQYGFGNSEIAFLKWEERGLLNPLISTPPGSPWWREVNLDFIYFSELAALVHADQLDTVKTLD